MMYPTRDKIATVQAYTDSVFTWMMYWQRTHELTSTVLSQIGEMLSPKTDPHRHAEMQGVSSLRSVCLQMLHTIGIRTEKPAQVVPREKVSSAPTRNTTAGMKYSGRELRAMKLPMYSPVFSSEPPTPPIVHASTRIRNVSIMLFMPCFVSSMNSRKVISLRGTYSTKDTNSVVKDANVNASPASLSAKICWMGFFPEKPPPKYTMNSTEQNTNVKMGMTKS